VLFRSHRTTSFPRVCCSMASAVHHRRCRLCTVLLIMGMTTRVVKPILTSAHRTTSSPRVCCSTASAVHHRRCRLCTVLLMMIMTTRVVKPFPTSAHQPPLLHESSATQPVLYTIGAVDFVPFSWWWAWWCPKYVETPINTSDLLHLVGYLFTFMIQDGRSHEIPSLEI
jgi:hypothetical protein